MDLFELLILIFILAPLLEAILKQRKGRGDTPPSAPPDGRQQRPDRAGRPQARVDRTPAEPAPGPASDMIPEELWQVLTGERRPGPASAETEAEWEHAADEVGWEAEEWTSEPDTPAGRWETMAGAEPEPAGDTRPGPEIGETDMHALPEARSLETFPSRLEARPMPEEGLSEDSEARHRRFHRKLDALSEPVTGYRQGPLPLGLGDRDQLRRAFILHTLLGPPRSLE